MNDIDLRDEADANEVCPLCAADLYTQKSDYQGLEYTFKFCEQCLYTGDPE